MGPVINMGIGLIMTFATMALVVSAVKEALSNFLNTRAKTLRQGLQALLNDPTLSGLAGKVLAHGAVNPLAPAAGGNAAAIAGGGPTRIEPKLFADALISVIQDDDPAKPLGDTLDTIQDPQIKAVLKGAFQRVNGDVNAFHQEVATWFDASMGRVADAYRRDAQLWSFWIAVVLVVLLNVDTFLIAQAIWASPAMAGDIPALGQGATDGIKNLSALSGGGFPIGWTEAELAKLRATADMGQWLWWLVGKLFGWAFTASASMLGAPFWFDLLGKARSAVAQPAPVPVKP